MRLAFAALALVFIIAGSVGFAFGGVPALFFWPLAALCIIAAWRARPVRPR